MMGRKNKDRVRGGESLLASRSSRETIYQNKRLFSHTSVMGDSVPLCEPAARDYALPTCVPGFSAGYCSIENVEEPII